MTPAAITLVLSGGGAKTAAHIGAARAIEESGLAPVRYVATSMGAVVAAALAGGRDRDQLLEQLGEAGRSGVVRDPLALVRGLFAGSLLRPEPFRRAVEQLIPVRRFADLPVPLTVAVVDLDRGELVLFGDGGEDAPLLDVLCATCALPVYFPPFEVTGRRCADGGLRGPLPLEVAARLARETVVAVDVGPGYDAVEEESDAPAGMAPFAALRAVLASVPPVVRAHDDAVGTLMAAATASQVAQWRADAGRPPLVYVRPRVERNATFRVDRVRRYAEDGYRATLAALTPLSQGADSAS